MELRGFDKVLAENRSPPAVERIPMSSFHPSANAASDMMIGVRPLSDADMTYCRGEALRAAVAWVQERGELASEVRAETYNDILMQLAVARGSCDPNDVNAPFEVWGVSGQEPGVVGSYLTSHGVKLVFDAIERVTIATSPVRPEIEDDQIQELAAKAASALAAMPSWQAARARRLLAFVHDEIVSVKR